MNDIVQYYYPANTPGAVNSIPANSVLGKSDGRYAHSLNDTNTAILNEVINRAKDDGIDILALNSYSLHPSLTILRYLRANDFDVVKTIDHMKRNLLWRNDNQIPSLQIKYPEEILNCELRDLTSVFPHWQIGQDKTGRPVLYKQYGPFDATLIKKLTG
eukprot:gene59813-81833_t